MPSSPRKRTRAKPREASKHDEDTDTDESCNSMPPLVHSDSDDSRDEWPHYYKASNNAQSVEMWLNLSKPTRDRHIRVMKIYLLSPFLFDSVEQEDKWINWAHECKLLSNKRNCDPSALIQDCIEAVDIIEEAFSKVAQYILSKEDSEETEKALGMMDKISTLDKLESAIICAESFSTFLKIRERIKTANLKRKGDSKRKADTSLLLVFQQIYDHIRKLTRENTDLTKQFEEMCKQDEQQSADLKKKGNNHFMDGKYKAAISAYSKAILMSQYNHILYGNRAQSYLRTGELWLALADGRRSVVLKPEWVKGQYRYAQAFFDLGDIERAISTNRAAKQSCQRNSKDLDSQYEKFLKERDIRARKVAKSMKQQEAQLKMPNDLEDLPDLVDADSTDTSEDSSDDEHGDDHNDEDDIDSSDNSNSEYESVPELVTDSSKDSDSEDSDHKRHVFEEKLKGIKSHMNSASKAEKELKTKRRKEKKLKPDTAKRKQAEISEGVLKKRDLNSAVKQGSHAYLEGKWQAAIHNYEEALQMLSVDDAFQMFKIKHIDYILILYSHGTACLETGIHKELLQATKQFEIIITQYKQVKFPLAFYGLGKVFHRQNRFHEALEPLNQGLNMVKIGGDQFGEYRWPGTQTIIQETEPGRLEIAFETIIGLCQHPPRPDAICRFTDCQGKTAIYLTDPDYKGYVRLLCSESCKIDYHPTCWKKYRTVYGEKTGDKDYLEEECMTPDCTATVVQILIYGSEGLKTEFAVDKQITKQKQGKPGKVKTHGIQKHTKLEKLKKEETKTEQSVEDSGNEDVKREDTATNLIINKNKTNIPKPDVAVEGVAKKVIKPINQDKRENRDNDNAVYILRKNEERLPDDLLAFKGAKGKSKKKKVKNVQSLDEFLKDCGGEVFKPAFGVEEEGDKPTEIPTMIPPSQWSKDELVAPFAVPAHLRSEIQAFEMEYNAGIEPQKEKPVPKERTPTIDPIEDYIISMITETLHAHGALDVGDARIIEPISFLPESHQQKIDDCGGIKQFLMKYEQFVVKGNVVLLPDELAFQEIVKNPLGKDSKSDINTSTSGGSGVTGSNVIVPPLSQQNGHPISIPPLQIPSLQTTVHEFIPKISYCSEGASMQPKGDNTMKPVFRDGVFTVEELSPRAYHVEKTPKPIYLGNDEKDNKDIKAFHASLEKVGIPPISESIAKLTYTTKEDNNFKENKKPVQEMSRMLPDMDSLPDQILQSPDQQGNIDQISLPKNKSEEKHFPLENTAATNKMEAGKCVDSKSGGHYKNESSTALNTATKHSRGASTGSDGAVGVKSKGIQTQLQVKSKGIMTDTMPEPFKAGYLKASQERDELQRKLQEVTDKLNNMQKKQDQELEKMKKKYNDLLGEKEKLNKELQSTKQEGKSEMKKMDKMCEEKDKLASSLEQRFKIEQDRYQSTIAGLKAELDANELELENERTKLNGIVSQKEESVKKANAAKQKQDTRAQDAEIKLLELRRDVGLRFLERSIHEATYTANNLINVRKASSMPCPKLDELINSWKLYFHDCQQKANLCKTSFNAQIQEVINGSVLSSLPQLQIPGPAAYPSQPILQLSSAVVSQLQTTFGLQLAKVEIPPSVPPNAFPPNAFPPVSTPLQRHAAPNPMTFASPTLVNRPTAPLQSPQRMTLPQNGPQPQVAVTPVASQQAQHNLPDLSLSANSKLEGDSKGRPSNSFERIMLRLSTAYPYLARAELTSLIKEVRQSKNGTLTGLSLEEIVQSVDLLIEAKVKVGVIRIPQGKQTSAPAVRNNQPKPSGVVNGATSMTTSAPIPTPTLSADSAGHQSNLVLQGDDDDPCVICHDDMNSSIEKVTALECGHKYHNKCIRKWLIGEQSTCPTCRVHALLPDEFPRLK